MRRFVLTLSALKPVEQASNNKKICLKKFTKSQWNKSSQISENTKYNEDKDFLKTPIRPNSPSQQNAAIHVTAGIHRVNCNISTPQEAEKCEEGKKGGEWGRARDVLMQKQSVRDSRDVRWVGMKKLRLSWSKPRSDKFSGLSYLVSCAPSTSRQRLR